jgi:hypothetical protein
MIARLGEHTARLASAKDAEAMYALFEPAIVKSVGHVTAIDRQKRVLRKKIDYYIKCNTAVVVEHGGVITGSSLSDKDFVVHFVSRDSSSMHSVMVLLYATLCVVQESSKPSYFKVVDDVGKNAFDIYVVSIDDKGNGTIPIEAKEVLTKRYKRLGGE